MTREELILGHLIMGTVQHQDLDIGPSFFTEKERRLIYSEILAGNGNLDEAELTMRLKGKVGAAYISNLLEGLPKSDSKNVGRYISEELVERLRPQAVRLIEAGAKSGTFDHAGLRKMYEEIDRLEHAGRNREDVTAETVEELAVMDIPKIERLIRPISARKELTIVAAKKGVGKSLFATQSGLHYSSGVSPMASSEITIAEPGRFLLIQQEVSLPGMVDRLQKMRMERVYNLEGRFLQKTTAGAWWDLTKQDDLDKVWMLVEKHEPDILALDALYTFTKRGVNSDKEVAPVLEAIFGLKEKYNLGIILVSHVSNKENPEEVGHAAGRIMGSSIIANAADNVVIMDFLEPRYKEQTLPLPFHHYVSFEITTRHGEWPQKFVAERGENCLLFEPSLIWEDIGKKILPGQIEDLLNDNDGEMLQKEVFEVLSKSAARTTVRRAIAHSIEQKTIEKSHAGGKGNPAILRLKK